MWWYGGHEWGSVCRQGGGCVGGGWVGGGGGVCVYGVCGGVGGVGVWVCGCVCVRL